jgi:hypothetical protein
MFLAAQRVLKRADSLLKDVQVGINAFVYLHGNTPIPKIYWHSDNINFDTGKINKQSYDVAPGGNEVLCFLDVVAEDNIATNVLKNEFEQFKFKNKEGTKYTFYQIEPIAIRFGAVINRSDLIWKDFDDMAVRLLDLLNAPYRKPDQTPLRCNITIDENEFKYELDDESVRKIQILHENNWSFTPLTIKHEIKMDFERVHGDIISNVIAIITGLRLERIIEAGGIEFYNKANGKLLRRWPYRKV